MSEARIYATVEKGAVKIEVEELFRTLDDKAKRRVARHIAFDQHIVTCVVDWLTKGEVVWDDPNRDSSDPNLWDDEADIPWYIMTGNGTVLEEVRLKLLEHRKDLSSRLIKDLILERDRITWERDQYQNLLWKLKNNWYLKDVPPSNPDYGERKRLTDEQVQELITKKEKEVSEGPK